MSGSGQDLQALSSLPQFRSSGREPLLLQHEDAVVIVERLRETHVDVNGHAFLLKLDTLIVRMGSKWELKQEMVFAHLKTLFERAYPEPNWCTALNGDAWLAMLPITAPRKGAMAVAAIWKDLCNFFVGDMSELGVPIYDVLAEDVDRFSIKHIDPATYFGPMEKDDAPIKARPGGQGVGAAARPAAVGPEMTVIQRPVMVAASVSYATRTLKVASAIEPLFEMKKMILIGHRLEAMVTENDMTLLDRKALASVDWNLREQVDVVNVEQGLMLLRSRTPEQRKMMMVVPAAFSTFASARARHKITQDVARAAAEMGLKVLFEVRGLDGVPPHRVLEVVSMIKPFCMTVVGSVMADRKAIAGLAKCGLSGVCVEYDGGRRDDATLQDYLAQLALAAKSAAGACLVQGFDNYRQMAVARLAGVTHASMKTAALMSTRTASNLATRAAEGLRDSDAPLASSLPDA